MTHAASVLTHMPTPPPEPVPGCDRCALLDTKRALAAAARDLSGVSDYNVLISRHPHKETPNNP